MFKNKYFFIYKKYIKNYLEKYFLYILYDKRMDEIA